MLLNKIFLFLFQVRKTLSFTETKVARFKYKIIGLNYTINL